MSTTKPHRNDLAKRPRILSMIFTDRQVLAMLLLGLASGLPYALALGTLGAWLTTVGVKPSAIGLLSWAALAYAFKFMWAAGFHSRRTPFHLPIGARRFWMAVFLPIMVIAMLALAFSDPTQSLLRIGLLSVFIAFISSCFDIVQAAWRIESARDDRHLDILSTVEQLGYRTASFLCGAVALIAAAKYGWQNTIIGLALAMAFCGIGIWLAKPSLAPGAKGENLQHLRRQGVRLSKPVRDYAVICILLCWGSAFYMLGRFMVGALSDPANYSASAFIKTQGPIIVFLTVIVLGIVAAFLVWSDGRRLADTPEISSAPAQSPQILQVLYLSILEPMMELVGRLKWSVVLILMLVLSYRFTDAIWGSFAYPFYLGENYGALGHTLFEIGIASKTIGVLATIFGIFAGGLAMLRFGRMPILVLGAFLAAITNLLYADLALGAHYMDGFLRLTRLGGFYDLLGVDVRMARLITTICAENIAGGLASVASIAYLSSIVNKDYAAVQYALLVSLTMLLGVLGRPTIGVIIENQGFAYAFILCAWFGVVAVILSICEWIRQSRASAMNATINGVMNASAKRPL